jgi:Zn-finger nucleic acid-binding protein
MQNCASCGLFMHASYMHDVEFHVCDQCRGMWFERGTLSRLLGVNLDEHLATVQDRLAIESTYECPRCHEPLCNRWLDTRPHVHIHECSSCGGIFLEKGELATMQAAYMASDRKRR